MVPWWIRGQLVRGVKCEGKEGSLRGRNDWFVSGDGRPWAGRCVCVGGWMDRPGAR